MTYKMGCGEEFFMSGKEEGVIKLMELMGYPAPLEALGPPPSIDVLRKKRQRRLAKRRRQSQKGVEIPVIPYNHE